MRTRAQRRREQQKPDYAAELRAMASEPPPTIKAEYDKLYSRGRPKGYNPVVEFLRSLATSHNGGDEKAADALVKSVLKKHGKDPDTDESWSMIYAEVVDQADFQGRQGKYANT